MKKIFYSLTIVFLFSFLAINDVFAESKVELKSDMFDIKIGETLDLDIIVSADKEIKGGSFILTTSSNNITFDSINFETGFTKTSNNSTISFKKNTGTVESGTKVGTIKLIASSSTKIGATATIVLRNIKLVLSDGTTATPSNITQKITAAEQVKELSDNTKLKTLTSTSANIKFKADVNEYNVEIDRDLIEFNITAEPDDQKAEVTVEGTEITGEENKIVVTVKAENGDTEKYIINAIKEAEEIKVSSNNKKWLILIFFFAAVTFVNLIALKMKK